MYDSAITSNRSWKILVKNIKSYEATRAHMVKYYIEILIMRLISFRFNKPHHKWQTKYIHQNSI